MVATTLSLGQAFITALAAQPALLVLALTILGVGYLMIRAGKGLCEVFKERMQEVSKAMENMGKNMQTMSEDLGKLSQSFEVHVVKTEYRMDTVEKRIERMEKLHIKEN